ncbi:recombinase family protein [Nocardia sp. NBC_00565]|uniref:recombinase family protein n=1 Tax=Nocardia sp. NBC_00565 TaxID=2975993 RepID=UPI002E807B3B|nr:recombinase family protein [Nocardia sp. NBC_00565]WUC03511.1 recombinase family protein [Nocardia sp. NBC_00565]
MARPRKKSHKTARIQTDRLDSLDTVRVGIYVRRSTDDEHQPYSIEAQDARLGSYVDSQPGWHIVMRFADDASGASTEREDLQRAMRAAEAGLIDVLLVYRVDRFSRNLRDMVTLLDDLDRHGVVFRSATEPFDTSTPMGRMLVQMLGMFAQFERDTIIDRVIAGMERKAAKGLWKGGRRPFGYLPDATGHSLTPHPNESPIVGLIYRLYTRDRLGSKAIARLLNERGHRTTTSGTWSGHQVLRTLSNPVYIGELSFRDITTHNCHPPLIDTDLFAEAGRILTERGDDRAHRRANASDYTLTGRMRCPKCHTAMIGTRAHGKTKVYRYYTCHTRNRYDSTRCDGYRLNADYVETAVLDALARFYRDHHTLIADAVTEAQRQHHAGHDAHHAELAAIHTKIADIDTKIDRYLTAFENGTMDEQLIGDRLAQLRANSRQLTHRRDELTATLDSAPTGPDPATLTDIADHITELITTGTDHARKTLIETLIAEIKITGPDTIVPVFRIPQPPADPHTPHTNKAPTGGKPPVRASETGVRAMANSVGLRGLEPLPPLRSSSCLVIPARSHYLEQQNDPVIPSARTFSGFPTFPRRIAVQRRSHPYGVPPGARTYDT